MELNFASFAFYRITRPRVLAVILRNLGLICHLSIASRWNSIRAKH